MAVSKVAVVALGLLAEEPMHGYELLDRYRERGMGSWAPAGKASVYQALQRLEREGLVAGMHQEGVVGPDRRVYRITRSGRDQLRRAVVERFAAEPDAGVALGFVHLLSGADARRGLDAREEALRWQLEDAAASRSRVAVRRGPGWSVAERLIARKEALLRAEIAWLGAFRRAVGRLRR